jgi:hypothetical protein
MIGELIRMHRGEPAPAYPLYGIVLDKTSPTTYSVHWFFANGKYGHSIYHQFDIFDMYAYYDEWERRNKW